MANKLLSILALLLAAFRGVVGDSTNLVRDGGFEAVTDHWIGRQGATSGGWVTVNEAEFEKNSPPTAPTVTPYGERFVSFYCSQDARAHSIVSRASHPVHHLVVGAEYQLSYAWNPTAGKPAGSTSYTVTFRVMLADQTLDSTTLSNQIDYPNTWSNRTQTFTAQEVVGQLRLVLDCTTLTGRDDPVQWFWVFADAVSIVALS